MNYSVAVWQVEIVARNLRTLLGFQFLALVRELQRQLSHTVLPPRLKETVLLITRVLLEILDLQGHLAISFSQEGISELMSLPIICLSIYFIYQYLLVSIYFLYIHPFIHPCMNVCINVYLSSHTSIYVCMYLSIHLSVYLSIHACL